MESGGSVPSFEELYSCVCRSLEEQGLVSDLSKQFSSQDTDEDRCKVLLACGYICDNLDVRFEKTRKSASLASKYKSDGNKNFQNKMYEAACEAYTKSIRFAEKNSSDLAIAFANRSATMFYMERWDASLNDIEHALDSSYPEKLRYKLYSRKGHCLHSLGRNEEAKAAFMQCIKAVEQSGLDKKKRVSTIKDAESEIKNCRSSTKLATQPGYKIKSMELLNCDRKVPQFSFEDSNAVYQSLSDSCDVAYTPTQGRFLRAKKDMFPGDIVLIEKPFASVLLAENENSFCHHCFKQSITLIPCQICTDAMFCSLECRNASLDSYHLYECGILELLYGSGIEKFGHLALRTVLKGGLVKLNNYKDGFVSGKYSKMDSDALLKGCNEDGLYLQDEYHAIHSLVTHDKDRSAHDLFRRGIMAIFLLQCVQKSTFLISNDACVNEAFIAGLLLSHLQSFPCNAHEIAELELNSEAVATSVPMELGAGIYASLSLFNHSCDPGVNRNFYGDTCVVRAIKIIKKGEEISDNYGAVYAVQSKPERSAKLKPQYHFECLCQPCIDNWPLYPDIRNINPLWRCDVCGSDIGPGSGKVQCPECKSSQDKAAKKNALDSSTDKYAQAFESLLSCEIDDACHCFEAHLKLLQTLVVLPWVEFNNCQEAVKQCYSIKANCHLVEETIHCS